MPEVLRPGPPLVASCDTLVALGAASRDRVTLFAKNSDRPPGECQPLALVPAAVHAPGAKLRCQYIEIPQARETAQVLGSRPVWLWGFEHGVNQHGVAIGNETVFAREAPAATGLLGMDLVRLGLERADSARAAVDVLTRLIEEHGQGGSGLRETEWPYNNSFLIADAGEAWVVEAAGRHWAARRARDVDSISNHISIGADWEKLSPGAEERARQAGWASGGRLDFAAAFRDREGVPAAFSEGRLRRSHGLLAARRGELTRREMMAILRDHGASGQRVAPGAAPDDEGFYTLCMHQGPGRTAASLVVELARHRRGPQTAWVSLGRPCTSVFLPLVVAGELPAALARGTEEPSDALWWVFERLAAQAERDPSQAERIRAALDELEASLASCFAREQGSLGAGGGADGRVATGLMAEIATRVERTARGLLSTGA